MAQSAFLVPVVNIPQIFNVDLAGITYTLTCKWNPAPDGGWVLDFADASQNPIVCNVPLITGCDCLAGLEYLGINGQLIVYTNGMPDAVPTLDNLGIDSNLYFITDVADNGV